MFCFVGVRRIDAVAVTKNDLHPAVASNRASM